MSVELQRFSAWSKQQGYSRQKHTVQGVLGLLKRAEATQVHSEHNGGDGGGGSCSCNPGDTSD